VKLIEFRVIDFRCIEDSGWVKVEDMTCLIGKNEAGKSALLNALNKLNPGGGESPDFNNLEEFPRWKRQAFVDRGEPATHSIVTNWELTSSEIEQIETIVGKGSLKSNKVNVSKGYGTKNDWTLDFDEQYKKDGYSATEALRASLLPKFVYFSKYDSLEGEVSITHLSQNPKDEKYKVFNTLMGLVRTTPQELQQMTKFDELQNKLETVSNGVSRTIKDYWKQNQYLKVKFDFRDGTPGDPPPLNSGKIFRTRIEDTRHEFTGPLRQRSTGFMWFFSFVIWFDRLQQTFGDNIFVLLDEPGLTLHGNAQEDLLRFMREKVLIKCPILYSTHSPFMVDGSHLEKVRAVEDMSTDSAIIGTKVFDDIFSVSRDTAFPLQAIMGFDIAQTLFVGPNNILVEGSSDILYFTMASQLLQLEGKTGLSDKWVLIPVGGADKVVTFVSLFQGNKLFTVVFLDSTKKKQKLDDLVKAKIMERQRILSPGQFIGRNEADIEDLFDETAYLEVINISYSKKLNGKIITSSDLAQGPRIIKRLETYFEANGLGEFSHYRPAYEAIRNPDLQTKLFTKEALGRFDNIFLKLNGFLSP
jgi:energy-coupling factor transporter ATP-binding protein EcfA2